MVDATQLGDVVALAIKAALAPVLAQQAALDAKLAALVPDVVDVRERVGSLRERLAVAEAVPPVPGPPGPAGKDGLDGVDAFTVDELVLTQDPASPHVVTLGYQRGDVTKSLGSVTLPTYCGVFDVARAYRPGESVTHGGSLWHCKAATTGARPGTPDGGDAWTLQVKRGGA